MREKKLFIYLVITWFTLLGIYIYIEKTGVKIFKEVEIFEIDKKVQNIGIEEAQSKIDALLSTHPIVFPHEISSIENNQSYTQSNQQTLNSIVSILKNIKSNVFVEIEAHSDLRGTNSKNRILSQKQADSILAFILKQYPSVAIDAIGYGEEFPLNRGKNTTNNRRIKITLQPLIPKI
jgi:outer membrane protein OmpA-like peptidoglycan-associated protein